MEIRNIAIIAHVDHGKTTLTDSLLKQSGVGKEGASMDSNALEQERGITIYAKNAAIYYAPKKSSTTPSSHPFPSEARGTSPLERGRGGGSPTKINIVDTPGHADFGSEVERVLRSIDSVLLVVDAQEGPMPQTRFVLKKSLELGLRPIVVINKIDKPAADPHRTEEQVLELFFELGASEAQANFPVVYAIGRQGIAKKRLTDDSTNLEPLLDTILEHVRSASTPESIAKPLRLQPFNLAYDNFLGRMAVARVYEGVAKPGMEVFIQHPLLLSPSKEGEKKAIRKGKILKLFTWKGMEKVETNEVQAGDIALIAGLTDIEIGETVSEGEDAEALPMIAIDEPTIELQFLVNNSPFGGREGKYVTSRQIREYLERELEVNVGLKVDFSSNEYLKVLGRGELHIAILLENMRRAGYEVQVSQPKVILRKQDDGEILEPFEEVIIDTPQEFQGVVIEKLGRRAFILKDLREHGGAVRLILEGPTRGILGYRSQFIIDTRGEGIMSSRVIGFRPYAGEISKRAVGSMISMATGKALGYALWGFQERGVLYIGPGTEVYEGMVIGNTSKGEQMAVNPTKGKQLTNVRASGTDEAIDLVPPYELTIERGLEVMAEDEYLEITPKSVRLRKHHLTDVDRSRAKRKDGK